MHLSPISNELRVPTFMPAKSLLFMKLLGCFMLVATLQVSASTNAQMVTLKGKKLQMQTIFETIKDQTGYSFVYDENLLKNALPVSINVTKIPLKDVLDHCFKSQPFTYEIKYKVIVVKRREIPSPQKPATREIPQPVNIQATGTVYNNIGEPLVGATISIKGTPISVITDNAGKFSIAVPEAGAILVISYVNYIPQEMNVTVTTRFPIDVTLQLQAKSNEEVVVIGYGTQKRKYLTGSVASIGPRELRQSPVANVSNSLAGRLPGLITVQNSGEPGADGANLYIRGLSTTGNNSPIILVDGIQRSFGDVDPNEIADISILKDAGSTAIYGINGANGVILVTTRRGSLSKPRVSVTLQNGWQSPTRLPKYADAYDGLTMYREGLINDGLPVAIQYTDSVLNYYRDRSKPAYEYIYPNVDWVDAMLKPYSLMQQANINVTGGNEFARYFVSMGYLRQNGQYKYEDQIEDYNMQAVTNKYNFRSNIDLQISRDLSMELGLGAIVRDRNYPGANASDIFATIKSTPAWWYSIVNPDGSPAAFTSGPASPYSLLTQSGYQRNFETNLQSTAGFKWDMRYLLPGLSSRVRFSFDNTNYRNVSRPLSRRTFLYRLKPGVIADTVTNLAASGTYQVIENGDNTLGYNVGANGSRRSTLEAYLNYDRVIGKHTIQAMALYTQSSFFDAIGGGSENAIRGLPFKNQGVIGRVMYNYDNRYTLQVSAAYNGAENFPAGNRFGLFPAVSAGWDIAQEKFIEESETLGFIDQIKIRGSYGIAGSSTLPRDNDGNPVRFSYLSQWNPSASGYQFGVNRDGNSYGGVAEVRIPNLVLTWEKGYKTDIGLDLGLWRGGLNLTAEYFQERRENILVYSELIPASVGLANAPALNAATVNKHGFDVSVEHRKEFTKQGYAVRINYSYVKNKIAYYAQPAFTGREWQARAGTEIGSIYGYTAIGLFRDSADIAKSPSQSVFGNTRPGDIKYKDINGDGIINTVDAGYLSGKRNQPTSILGVSLSYHYAGLDVSVLFQGAYGGSLLVNGSGIFPFSRFAGVLAEVKDNHWVPSNPDGNYKYPRLSSQDNTNNQANSTFWIYSSDYLRLKTVEIGYSIPKYWLTKIGFNNVRVFVNGINLVTWDKLKIFDPEIANSGTGTYPQQRVINTGLNFSF